MSPRAARGVATEFQLIPRRKGFSVAANKYPFGVDHGQSDVRMRPNRPKSFLSPQIITQSLWQQLGSVQHTVPLEKFFCFLLLNNSEALAGRPATEFPARGSFSFNY